MVDDKPKPADYLHAFTLYQDPGANKDTSAKARTAYTDALKASGFKPHAPSRDGTSVHLPGATLIGTFPSDAAAIAAVKDAETAARTADPGKFFRESAVLTRYERLRLVGPKVAEPAPTAAAKLTRAGGIMARILEQQDPKRD